MTLTSYLDLKKMKTRRYKDGVIVEFHHQFVLRYRHPVILRTSPGETDYLIEGELTATVADPFVSDEAEKLQTHKWNFSLKARKVFGDFIPLQFVNRDQNGSYSTFFRALIWDYVKKAF